MSRLKTFHEIFSQEDVEIAENIISTYNCGRSVIGINAPSETNQVAAWMTDVVGVPATITLRTPRLEYAIRVLAFATAITTHSDDDLFDLWMGWRWKQTDGGFKELEFENFRSDKTLEELCEGFWKILEEIANSGNLYVTKGYYPSEPKDVYLGLGLDWVVVCDQEIINKSDAISFSVDALNQQWDNSKISFSWDEIKELFHQLTPNQMRIIRHKKLLNHTELDNKLLDACGCWDLDEIKKYVEEGANINCLDEDGQSVLARAVEFPDYEWCVCDEMNEDEIEELMAKDYEKCIRTIDLLLSYGADINLYGAEGLPPLRIAYIEGNIPLVVYLLDRGADYNLPKYMTEVKPSWLDSPKEEVLEALARENGDMSKDSIKILERMILDDYDDLENHKGVIYDIGII